MLDLIRELFRYQSWADEQIVAAVKAHPPAAADPELLKTLHHIVGVQRFFLAQIENRPFDMETEQRVPSNIDEMAALFRETHDDGVRCLDALQPADLDRVLDRPPLDKYRPTVRIALTQAVMHSQHHRGQVATRLRQLGATPPTVDYIRMALGQRA